MIITNLGMHPVISESYFHVEDNGILVEYAYSFLRLTLTLPNFDFITAQASLITAQMGSVTPLL